MVMQRWDPYQDMRQLERAMDRMWRAFGTSVSPEQWNIPIDVVQKGDEIVVKASLPGVKPEQIDVSVEDNVLTLKAESEKDTEQEEAGYLVRERSYGSFYRALRLPESVNTDKIKSSYDHGVLTITLPKAEEKKRKQIQVSVKETPKVIESGESRKK